MRLHRWKVTGTVRFSVNYLVAKSPEDAEMIFRETVPWGTPSGREQESIEVLEVNVDQDLGPCSQRELKDYLEVESVRKGGEA